MSPPCRFYNKPGGCRKGNQCPFSHDSSPSSSRPNPSRQGPLPNAPKGICNFYWSTGSCRREFGCRFAHTQNPSSSSPEPSTSSTTANSLAPFLTEAGLAKLNAPGTDVFFPPPSQPRSANEIHNHLKKYLREDFRFEKTYDIYGFLDLLGSIDLSNPRWVGSSSPKPISSVANIVL